MVCASKHLESGLDPITAIIGIRNRIGSVQEFNKSKSELRVQKQDENQETNTKWIKVI